MKRCPDCELELPESDFWKRSASRDGLAPACRGCMFKRRRRYSSRPGAQAERNAKRRVYEAGQRWRSAFQDWVRRELRAGRLVRPERCPECDADSLVCAYAPALDRPWLWRCRRCIQKQLARRGHDFR